MSWPLWSSDAGLDDLKEQRLKLLSVLGIEEDILFSKLHLLQTTMQRGCGSSGFPVRKIPSATPLPSSYVEAPVGEHLVSDETMEELDIEMPCENVSEETHIHSWKKRLAEEELDVDL